MKMTVSNVDRGFGSLQQKNNDFCLAHMHLATLYEYNQSVATLLRINQGRIMKLRAQYKAWKIQLIYCLKKCIL